MTRRLSLQSRPTSGQLLSRILDEPSLPAQIKALPAEALAKLVERVGLEDAGEIVAMATTEQLANVFDEDLWKSDRPGEDERFDSARFVVWLGVMREAGDRFVADKLSELPEDLVTLAFHRELVVFGLDELAEALEEREEEGQAVEKALASALSEEIDEYLVVSRRHDGWDDVLAALLALDESHHELLARILERCRSMTARCVEEDGLYEVLTSSETLEDDVAGDREDRRAEMGFVAPTAAAAFLKLARTGPPAGSTERDPTTRAYFRNLSRTPRVVPRATTPMSPSLAALIAPDRPAKAKSARPRLAAGHDAPETKEPLLTRAMRELAKEDRDAFEARSEEVAYLANVLRAGLALPGGARLRPAEAVEAAIAVTSLGLREAVGARTRNVDLPSVVQALRNETADGLFRRAWHLVERDVIQPAGRKLTAASLLSALEAL